MNKKIFLAGAALFISAAMFSQTTFFVKKSGSDSNDGSTEAKAFATVGKAVSSVQDNVETVIYLEEGATFNMKEQPVQMYASLNFGDNKKVTIIGKNTTIQGASQPGTAGEATRIMRATTGTDLKIVGVTFENGRQIDYSLGGAIFFGGNTLEIDSCRFINNEAGSAGAGIGSRGKTLIVRNSYFEGNYLLGGGSYGAAIMHAGTNKGEPGSSLLVENTTFYKNNTNAAGGYGMAIGTYDATLGSQYCNLKDMKVVNCTFVENTSKDVNQCAIDITMADELETYLINNTFYKNDGALYLNFNIAPVYLINNVIFAEKSGVLSNMSVEQGREEIIAYNNVIYGNERGVNENIDDVSLTTSKNEYNNIVGITDANAIASVALATTLSTDRFVPYLKITSESSILVDKGMDDSSSLFGENLIPDKDICGLNKKGIRDIGAYEYGGGTSIGKNFADAQSLMTVYNGNGTVTLNNVANGKLTVKIISVDGKTVYSADVTDGITLSKTELGAEGLYIITATDGKISETQKIVVF